MRGVCNYRWERMVESTVLFELFGRPYHVECRSEDGLRSQRQHVTTGVERLGPRVRVLVTMTREQISNYTVEASQTGPTLCPSHCRGQTRLKTTKSLVDMLGSRGCTLLWSLFLRERHCGDLLSDETFAVCVFACSLAGCFAQWTHLPYHSCLFVCCQHLGAQG